MLEGYGFFVFPCNRPRATNPSFLQATHSQRYRGCLHRGRKILEGGTTLLWGFMQKFWSVKCPSREEKNKKLQIKAKLQFGPSCVSYITIISSWLRQTKWSASIAVNQRPNERRAAIFIWFVPSARIFLPKEIYMVLGSSYL